MNATIEVLNVFRELGYDVQVQVVAFHSGTKVPVADFTSQNGEIVLPGVRCDNPSVQATVVEALRKNGGKISLKAS